LIRQLLLYGREEITLEQTDDDGKVVPFSIRVADLIVVDILRDDLEFESAIYGRIFAEFIEARERDEVPDDTYFKLHHNPEIAHTAIDLMVSQYELSESWEKNSIIVEEEPKHIKELVLSAMLSFKAKKLDKIISAKQKELCGITDQKDIDLLLVELRDLKTSNIQINKELGRIITK